MIWLIGGTSESRAVAVALDAAGLPWLATVVSDRARQLYEGRSGAVYVGALSPDAIAHLVQSHGICCIVDASHPFAVDISQQAIATGLPYLRLERPSPAIAPSTLCLPTWDAVLQEDYLTGRRILLTVGVKTLARFVPWLHHGTFWARILPVEVSMHQAIQVGFPSDRLIPMALPVTIDQERDLWRSLSIDTVITKSAGQAGGLDVKQQVAQELGVRLIVIDRPAIAYPQQTSVVADISPWCQQQVGARETT
jgi:precorrin-6A/cobalt-precorrin-6A reductase